MGGETEVELLIGTLSCVAVVDLSVGVARPLGAKLPAEAGAKVRMPRLPASLNGRPGTVYWNSGKREVDNQTGADLLALIAESDICIVGGSSGQWDLAAQGVSKADALTRFPGLVFAHVAAYVGETTPWAGRIESDCLLSATLGLAAMQVPASSPPIALVYPLALYAEAILAATAAAAGLVERASSDLGQVATVGGMHRALALMVSEEASPNVEPVPRRLDPETEVVETQHRALSQQAFVGVFRCGDGYWVTINAAMAGMAHVVPSELGLDHIWDDPRIAGRDLGYSRYDLMFGAIGCHSEYVEAPEGIRPALERARLAEARRRERYHPPNRRRRWRPVHSPLHVRNGTSTGYGPAPRSSRVGMLP